MATHRQHGSAEQGAPGYSAGPYQSVDYPSAGPGYPADGTAERRYAERIPRYPDGESRARDATPGEDLRLGDGDLPGVRRPTAPPSPTSPAAPTRPAPPSQPVDRDEPTATYPTAPPVAPQAPNPPQQQPVPQAGPPHPAAQQAAPPQAAPPQAGTPLSELLHDATQYTEPVAPYPPASPVPDDGVYRGGGKPQLAWILAGLAVLFEIPVAYVLVRSLAAPGVAVSGVVSGLFLLPGVPLFAVGLYHLLAGHVTVRPGEGLAALVRRPLALLAVGTVLLLAAAVAAG